jgi:hypothetical protein
VKVLNPLSLQQQLGSELSKALQLYKSWLTNLHLGESES